MNVCVLFAVTPPGHFTAGGMTANCPAGSFRAEWAVGANAASCTPCGAGVAAKENSEIVQSSTTFPYVATSIRVADSSGACCKYQPVCLLALTACDASAHSACIALADKLTVC